MNYIKHLPAMISKPNLFILLLCISPPVISLASIIPPSQSAPIYFTADKAQIDNLTHRGKYLGHVEVKQGQSRLTAEKMITLSDKKNQLIKAIATGEKKQPHYFSRQNNGKAPLNASADTIEFYPRRHTIKLLGNALILQGKNRFVAPKIEYNTQTQQVLSHRSSKGRTRITFHSKKRIG